MNKDTCDEDQKSLLSSENSSESSEGINQRIVLHVYDDESKEFTSLTTYHGMIRIYTSNTWPSRIFWSLVVVTCLTLFMTHSGIMLFFYHSHPTFFKTMDEVLKYESLPAVSVCRYSAGTENFDLIHNIFQFNGGTVESSSKKTNYSSMDEYIWHNRFNCSDVVASYIVSGQALSNPCSYASISDTSIGHCLTFQTWPAANTLMSLAVQIKLITGINDEWYFRIHPREQVIRGYFPFFALKSGYHTFSSIKIRTESLLHKTDWGSCENDQNFAISEERSYSKENCEADCIAQQYLKRCHCVPFHVASNDSNLCSPAQYLACGEFIHSPCKCNVACKSTAYVVTTPTFLKINTSTRTVLDLSILSRKVTTIEQLKRLKAADLLSFVAGSMGLFLGMSCVTVLEIFIYLFKTVWGAFNGTRYKAYLGQFDDDEPNALKRSYEQIVITTKRHGQDKLGNADVTIEENFAVMTDPHTKRKSIMRMGPRQSVISEGRSRSNTAISIQKEAPITIQLVRPNMRRKSMYSAAFGNF